ncbi:poly(hydroxyalkanoate) granule-associated protein [Pseudomonas fluvialis]|jgi:poly(hydroxyalkanoate) granule-associated protein|uniref:Poly(Hydroxyalkanoate) granule-associated protein n=1 Tax=Pseudomonas fluvialis TaxID=1793966 RepID=A0A7X0BRL0_9PSED|nr:phasin family protein [Pseudomonas fluvialis]MBB6340256.1 poly(hydroxyalkanoate) granule-associated protein [Pseudomonas fluvialis]
MAKVAAKKVEEKATLLTDVKHAARQIWLAGLGAYSKAGQEGADYLKDLIKSGESVEKQGKKLVTEQVEAANDTVKTGVSSVKEKVEVQLDKVEKAFDARVASALNRLGIPSKKDVTALSAKLDELSALLEHASRNK